MDSLEIVVENLLSRRARVLEEFSIEHASHAAARHIFTEDRLTTSAKCPCGKSIEIHIVPQFVVVKSG